MSVHALVRWTLLGTLVNAIVQFTKLVVMARVLTPVELGAYAVILTAAAIFYLFQDFGLSSFYVHKSFVSERMHTALFRLSILMGAGSAMLLCLVALGLGLLYDSSVVTLALLLMSANYLVLGFLSQFQAILIKTKRLKVLALSEIASSIFSLLVFWVLIKNGLGVYSYVFSVVAYSIIKLGFVFLVVPWRPRLTTRVGRILKLKKALSYGGFQFGGQLINHLRSRLDVLILGRLVGLEVMGLYGLAKETVVRPQGLLQPVVSRVSLPIFAKKIHSGECLDAYYFAAVKKIALAHFVIFLVLILTSDLLVAYVYGKETEIVGQLIRLLSLFAFLRSVGMPIGSLTQATGRTGLDFRWNVVALVFGLVPLAAAVFFDIHVVVVSIVTMQFFLTCLSYFLTIRPCLSGASFTEFLRSWAPLFLGLLATCNGYEYVR